MKKLLCFLMLLTAPVFADDKQHIGVGFGKMYGGFLGANYSLSIYEAKVYLGVGLLAYSSVYGSELGYSLGVERQLGESKKHSLGISFGTVDAVIAKDERVYIGGALNYVYYFSGFDQNSWLLGASYYSGKRDTDSLYFKQKEGGFIILGYQF